MNELREQSRHGEDLNGQLGLELEQRSRDYVELQGHCQDLNNRLALSEDETEQLQKLVSTQRGKIFRLDNENAKLWEGGKQFQFDLNAADKRNSQLQEDLWEWEQTQNELLECQVRIINKLYYLYENTLHYKNF